MKFSSLERNDKTFNLLCHYLKEISSNQQCCFSLDNRIQAEEIQNYLVERSIPLNDHMEIQHWIEKYSQSFRAYLNSVKLAAMMLLSRGITPDSFKWKEFCEVEQHMSLYKGNCLDTIF